MAGDSALLRKRPLVLGALALLVALAIAVTLAVTKPWASTKDRDDVAAPAAGDRVLQSVDVTMQGDGALTRVGDTVVVARAQGGPADTYSTTYDPTKVVDQLPVRVLTAYGTDQGSGTDLADLKGYSGRVTINLTVQNLTVKPQQITYDVAGKAQTTTALVGAPLTVVASAALPGIDPATVVSAAADAPADSSSDTGSTNGVLSKAADGTTQIQWASILAPPQLDSTATFRVVVDAKNFVVPTVDLSVQPGLVTDPSVGALIDSAFNPKNSEELALETRTIALIGDVNDVLGRSSDTISSVRKTLDASSKTLGTKTVQSLTEDTKTISTSLKTSSDNIDSLGDALKSSLETTRSATLERMSETVSGLQDLIGDTSASEPAVQTDGTGCERTVKASGAGSGVYASLLAVTAQLDAYGDATDACRESIKSAVTATLGPDTTIENGATLCAPEAVSSSVTCSLEGVRDQLTAAVEVSQGTATDLDASVQAVLDTLDEQLGGIEKGATDLGGSLGQASDAVGSASDALKSLSTEIDRLKAAADVNVVKVASMQNQTGDLAKRICDLEGTGSEPGRLSPADADELRGYVAQTSCDGDRLKPKKWSVSLKVRLQGQEAAWRELSTELATSSRTNEIGPLLTELAAALTVLEDQLVEVEDDVDPSDDEKRSIAETAAKARTTAAELDTRIEANASDYAKARTALDDALSATSTLTTEALDPAIKEVAAQAVASNKQLDTAFDEAAKGLSSAADQLRDGAAQTLQRQSDDLADREQSDKAELNDKTEAGLSTISSSVTSATRDIDTTRTSLTKDLNNVLLDLGNPEEPGKGLLGTLGKSARAGDSADFQLGLASDKVSSYSSVRSQEVGGILLRQAQAEAALQRQAELPAFATELPSTTTHRTIYLFHLGEDR